MRNDDIQPRLDALSSGGCVSLPTGDHPLDCSVTVNGPCKGLQGEIWAYNADPNGVFEARGGTKLKMVQSGFPAITVADEQISEGGVIANLGVQGAIVGMDTRNLFNTDAPAANAGLCFRGQRVDQGEFAKLSFCGLASGLCACGQAELDACVFERLNTDGCCIGIYYAPRASYNSKIRSCVVGDTPWYGLWMRSGQAMHDIEISELMLIRNCGAPVDSTLPVAAAFLENVSRCTFSRNLIDDPGTFWYYSPDATSNGQRQPSHREATGLYITGNRNRICDNTILQTKSAIVVHGDGNILMNNIVSGDIVLEGRGNVIVNPVFTEPEARLILKNAPDTQLTGVAPERIIHEG